MTAAKERAEEWILTPDRETSSWLAKAGVALSEKVTLSKLMQRQDFDLNRFLASAPAYQASLKILDEEEAEGVVARLRYAGYIERQEREAARMSEDENLQIPREMTYSLPGLSREMVEKLTFVRPVSLGQAGRIPGVTPAAIAILRMHLRRGIRVAAAS